MNTCDDDLKRMIKELTICKRRECAEAQEKRYKGNNCNKCDFILNS